MIDDFIHLARRLGASDAAAISAKAISVEDDLANLCREPRCENYGLSMSCPPHVPGPSIFQEWLKIVEHAVVIKIDVPMEILLSNERRDIMRLLHEIAAEIEQSAVGHGCSNSKAFAGGSCKKIFCQDHSGCRVLTEGGECRNPQHARPSMSGFGINVSKMAKIAGWRQNWGTRGTSTGRSSMGAVFGLILIG
jgi:predicted metal-binding protein